MLCKNAFAFGLLAILGAILLMMAGQAHGRYLPTRSNVDQARRAQIKEILRLLLDTPTEDELENRHRMLMSAADSDMYELRPLRAGLDSGESSKDLSAHRSKRDVSGFLTKV